MEPRGRIVGFLDQQLRDRAGFSIQDEYPSVFGEYPGGESLFVERNGKVVSHLAYVARDFHHPEFRLKIGLIGSVATAAEYREQGFASTLVRSALTELKSKGCAIALLWSDTPEFYVGFGFERAGRERDFRFSPQAVLEGATSSVPFDPGRHGHWIWRLYLKHAGRLDRSLEEQKRLFRVPKARVFVTEKDGEVTSYLVIHKGADFANYIHEWGGDLMAVRDNIASTQKQFFAEQPLTLIAPSHYDLAPLRSIASEEWPGVLGLIKVLDRGTVMANYLNHLKKLGRVASWQRDAGTLKVDGQLYPVQQESDFIKLVFGNEETPVLPVLPFFLWGFDSI